MVKKVFMVFKTHLDMGFTEAYLASELAKSGEGKFTPMCFDNCRRCGVCRTEEV